MARYYLRNPRHHDDLLKKQVDQEDGPIYRGQNFNDYFRLVWSDRRLLLGLSGPNGDPVADEAYPVPDNWDGDPETIGIDQSTWDNLIDLHNRGNLSASETFATLVAWLRQGNILRAKNADGEVVWAILQAGELLLTPSPPKPFGAASP